MPRQTSTNGPDWTDIHEYLTAYDRLHGSTTWLAMQRFGRSVGTGWLLTVTSVYPRLKKGARYRQLATQVQWPNENSATIEGAYLALLYKHDADTSAEMYTQEALPGF